MALPGALLSAKKDGTEYYRASFTYKGRHISLGSFPTETEAHAAYIFALRIVQDKEHLYPTVMREIEAYREAGIPLSFDKWVMLLNLRDNGIYCHNPIYLHHRFFYYCLDPETLLHFDAEELFYYMNHKIQRRGGHLFVADYGMQVSIFSRYGIKNYAVPGKDFFFANGDYGDFRSGNIEIVNPYHGVKQTFFRGDPVFVAKIHINGDYVVGHYSSVEEAAVAYNKAAEYLMRNGFDKKFPINYIEGMDELAYASLYQKTRISKRIKSILDVKPAP